MNYEEASKILEVDSNSPKSEIKKKYLQMVKFYHPDNFQGNSEKVEYAEQMTKRVNEAWAFIEENYDSYHFAAKNNVDTDFFTPISNADIGDRVIKAYKKSRITFNIRFVSAILSYISLFAWGAVFANKFPLFLIMLLLGACAGIIACPFAIPKVTMAIGKFWYNFMPIPLIDLLGYLIGFGWIITYSVFAPFIISLFGVYRAYRQKQEVRLSLKIAGIQVPKKDWSKVQLIVLITITILIVVAVFVLLGIVIAKDSKS